MTVRFGRAAHMLASIALAALLTSVLAAQEETFDLPSTVVEGVQPAFDPVIGGGAVFGDTITAFDAPGSGAYLSIDDIQSQSYDDVNRVLRRVPGVYLREEDGFGNFPNISLRGVDTTRSAKVSIMEDGILTAPAPYSAPAAYYFPTVGRMSAVEVIKGHAQIRYGPQTTGGAINFLSTPIPQEGAAYLRTMFGTNNEYRVHAWVGDTFENTHGRWGYLLEGYLRESDGFKTIDQAPDFRDPDTMDTGFSSRDPMLKLFWEPNTVVYQRWEVKAGYSDFKANETYLGLSEADIAADPFRRYTASRFDNFDSKQVRSYLRYTLGNLQDDCWSLTSTAYYNNFHRNWYKLHDINAGGGNTSLAVALAGGGAELDLLRGTGAGSWRYRANNRRYWSYGYDSVLTTIIDTEHATHTVSGGVRYHADQIHPFQHNDVFTVDATGTVTAIAAGAPASQRNREQEVHSIAFYAQDEIDFGRLKVTPGVRFEHLNMSEIDHNGGTGNAGDLDLSGGGVGLTYDINDDFQFLGGVHRGFSPPSPRGRLRSGLKEEEAIASEFGLRYLSQEQAIASQLVYFYSHFNDLIVIDNLGGAGVGGGADENVGEVLSQGIEFSFQYDAGIAHGWSFSNPWFVSMTYTDAELINDASSADPESLFNGGLAGNKLPYIPEFSGSLGTGIHGDLIGFDITGIFVDEMFTSASNVQSIGTNGTPEPDSRFGKTDSYFIWDISMYAMLADNWKLFGGIQNVFDDRYIVSRHPHGPRPGAPLFGYVGVETVFGSN